METKNRGHREKFGGLYSYVNTCCSVSAGCVGRQLFHLIRCIRWYVSLVFTARCCCPEVDTNLHMQCTKCFHYLLIQPVYHTVQPQWLLMISVYTLGSCTVCLVVWQRWSARANSCFTSSRWVTLIGRDGRATELEHIIWFYTSKVDMMSVETFTCLMNGSFYEGDPPLPSPQLGEKPVEMKSILICSWGIY